MRVLSSVTQQSKVHRQYATAYLILYTKLNNLTGGEIEGKLTLEYPKALWLGK